MWFKKKNKREEVNSLWVVYVMWIVFLFEMIKLIIQSWEWVNFLILIFISVALYFWIKFINKRRKERPTSLPKKFRNKYLVVPQYIPPKDLNPAEAWLLYNCKVDVSDLTSLIYQWAFEWLISIKSVEAKEDKKRISQIELIKLKEIDETRPFFETEIFNSIFYATHKKTISNSFELRYALMLEDLEIHWIKKWWVVRSWEWKLLKNIYNLLVALLLLSWYLYIRWWLFVEHPGIWIFVLILLLACIILWWYVDWGKLQLTDKWAKLASYVIGYRNFIKSCDENMIKLYLKEDPLFFDKTLPYATAFWLETEFLNKVTPLAEDWKAQYVNWQKVTIWMKIIATLLQWSNKSRYDIFYHW